MTHVKVEAQHRQYQRREMRWQLTLGAHVCSLSRRLPALKTARLTTQDLQRSCGGIERQRQSLIVQLPQRGARVRWSGAQGQRLQVPRARYEAFGRLAALDTPRNQVQEGRCCWPWPPACPLQADDRWGSNGHRTCLRYESRLTPLAGHIVVE